MHYFSVVHCTVSSFPLVMNSCKSEVHLFQYRRKRKTSRRINCLSEKEAGKNGCRIKFFETGMYIGALNCCVKTEWSVDKSKYFLSWFLKSGALNPYQNIKPVFRLNRNIAKRFCLKPVGAIVQKSLNTLLIRLSLLLSLHSDVQ